MRPLTAATYNIRKAVGADKMRLPSRILGVVEEIGPDIVVLQEADRRFGARQSVIPESLLSDHGFKAVPFGVRDGGLGWHGNAILVRDEISILDKRIISIPTLEPRGAVLTKLEVGGQPFYVVGMHLDLSGLWRKRQTRAIRQELAALDRLPTILMGDMNEWQPNAWATGELAIGYKPVPVEASFPAKSPLVRLDRVFVSDDVEVEDAGVHLSPVAMVASDHLPVWMRFRLDG